MIAGIGTDIAEVSRFEKWIKNPEMLERFFNENEISTAKSETSQCQHYAARFAAKEAFSKALGTGITDFNLREVYITNNSEGAPLLNVEGAAFSLLQELASIVAMDAAMYMILFFISLIILLTF